MTTGHESMFDEKVKVVLDDKGRDVYTISPEATAAEAVGEMNDRGGGRLAGIVSSGDLTRWVTRRQEIHIRDLTEYIQGTYPV